jgi:hypothetical protein
MKTLTFILPQGEKKIYSLSLWERARVREQ